MDSNHACLAVISLDSARNKDGNSYPQVFLKDCKYIEKKVICKLMIILVILVPLVTLVILMKNSFSFN